MPLIGSWTITNRLVFSELAAAQRKASVLLIRGLPKCFAPDLIAV